MKRKHKLEFTMRHPRIAVMSTGLGHVTRGIETWADGVATELHRRGVDVTLFKGAGPAARPFERVIPCLKRRSWLASQLTRWAPRSAWHLGLHQTYDVEQTTFAAAVLPHLIRHRYDLIHLQDPWLALLLERTRRLHGATVVLGHGTDEAPWLLQNFQHVQELSPFYLGRHGDLRDKKWFAVPNFVDSQVFRPGDQAAARRSWNLPDSAFVVLSISALNRSRKRLDWIARELAAADRPDALLVLAGASDPESPSLLSEIRQLLGHRVRVFEDTPRSRMPSLCQAADVHALASLQEVMSVSILESMSSGVPNIGHSWGSVEWAIGDTGWIVPMDQPGRLASTLATLDRAACADAGRRARNRVLQLFAVESVVDQIQRMYAEILDCRASGRRQKPRGDAVPA